MFIPENTYARNRKNPDATVYLTTNGEICLTRDDFESEEEFLRWKAWSDKNYQEQAHHDRPFHDNTYLTGDYESAAAWMEISGGTEETGGRLDAQSGWNRFRAVYPHVKRALTKKQRRRLELFLHGMTVGEISQAEGVPHQDISKSIAAAKRKLVKIMKKLENFYEYRVPKGCVRQFYTYLVKALFFAFQKLHTRYHKHATRTRASRARRRDGWPERGR